MGLCNRVRIFPLTQMWSNYLFFFCFWDLLGVSAENTQEFIVWRMCGPYLKSSAGGKFGFVGSILDISG